MSDGQGNREMPAAPTDAGTTSAAIPINRHARQATLIARMALEAQVREEDLAALRSRLQTAEHELESAEHELQDLRAIRDAMTPPAVPQRSGMDLAAAFLPVGDERVSGDFYLVAEGPKDSTVLVIGDATGHGLRAARRATFVRTAFIATVPFSDDPARLLSWVNAALIDRAGVGADFVTAACVTYLPGEQLLRWAYAGHPPALWLDTGQEMSAPGQGIPLGIEADPGYIEGSQRIESGAGLLLYTDGLTEARHDGRLFGADAVSAVLGRLHDPSAGEAVAVLRAVVAEFAYGGLTDDLCLLTARIEGARTRARPHKNAASTSPALAALAHRCEDSGAAEQASPARRARDQRGEARQPADQSPFLP